MTLGKRLTEARKAKGCTQKYLADLVNVTRAAVGQWELDLNVPTLANAVRVAEVLGVDPAWLAFGMAPSSCSSEQQNPQEVTAVPLISFAGDAGEVVPIGAWAIPSNYMQSNFSSHDDAIVLFQTDQTFDEERIARGDLIFLDRSDIKPSPGGLFLYWDGLGMSLARIYAFPNPRQALVTVTHSGHSQHTLKVDEVRIFGRVIGFIHLV